MHEHTRFRSRGLISLYLRGAGRGKSFLGHTGVAHVTCVRQRAHGGNLSILSNLIPLAIILLIRFYLIDRVSIYAAARRALQFALAGRNECNSRNGAGARSGPKGEGEQNNPN